LTAVAHEVASSQSFADAEESQPGEEDLSSGTKPGTVGMVGDVPKIVLDGSTEPCKYDDFIAVVDSGEMLPTTQKSLNLTVRIGLGGQDSLGFIAESSWTVARLVEEVFAARLEFGTPVNVVHQAGILCSTSTLCEAGLTDGSEVTFVKLPTKAHEPKCWKCTCARGIGIRKAPDLDAPRVGQTIPPGAVFEVSEEVLDGFGDGEGWLFLRLADGRGWAYNRIPHSGVVAIPQVPSMMDFIAGF